MLRALILLALSCLLSPAFADERAQTQQQLDATRQDIAEMTGTTLHTVSRVLSAWEAQGLVEGGRQKLTVVDIEGLALIADPET